MTFWEIIWLICKIPLGLAAIGVSCIIGRVVYIVASFVGYCVWCQLTHTDERWNIIGRKWEDD